MNATTIDRLGTAAAETAMRAAADYLRPRAKLTTDADLDRAASLIRNHAKAAVGPALDDARAAIDCGMVQVAETTFLATMAAAGIAAAKEFLA